MHARSKRFGRWKARLLEDERNVEEETGRRLLCFDTGHLQIPAPLTEEEADTHIFLRAFSTRKRQVLMAFRDRYSLAT